MIRKQTGAALAAIALASASQAQTTIDIPRANASVTLYGLFDVYAARFSGETVNNPGLATQSVTKTELTGFNTGGWAASRLGFRGNKSFDNGLTALFTLEAGNLNLNSTAPRDNGLTSTRKSFVGLSGNFGQVIAGRLQTPAFDWSNTYDASAGVFSPLVSLQSMAGVGINSFDRVNNAATWSSPNWSGLKAQATIGFPKELHTNADDGVAANHKQSVYLLHANYAKGPLSVGAVVRMQDNTSGVCALPATPTAAVRCSTAGSEALQDGRKEWGIGGSYDFKLAKLFATYQVQDSNSLAANSKISHIGARFPVLSKGAIVGAYASGKRGAAKANAASIAYTHDLDKSTKLYAGWFQAKNANPATPLGTISVGGSVNMTANKSVNGIAAGLSYAF